MHQHLLENRSHSLFQMLRNTTNKLDIVLHELHNVQKVLDGMFERFLLPPDSFYPQTVEINSECSTDQFINLDKLRVPPKVTFLSRLRLRIGRLCKDLALCFIPVFCNYPTSDVDALLCLADQCGQRHALGRGSQKGSHTRQPRRRLLHLPQGVSLKRNPNAVSHCHVSIQLPLCSVLSK